MILLALILWPLAEIAVALAVAHAIGILPCILLVLVGWPIGAALMRAQGRATAARLREVLSTGRAPDGLAADGVLALLAGPLLIVPGMVSDAVAALLLVPAVRRRCWSLAAGRLTARRRGAASAGRRADDVDGTAHETTPSDRVARRPQLHG